MSPARLPTILNDVARQLLMDARSGSIFEGLRANGIHALVLKGPCTSARLYAPRGRPYGDVDLLVGPVELDRAREWLLNAGFEPGVSLGRADRPEAAQTWFRPSDGTNVDLHRTLTGIGLNEAAAWRALWSHRVEMDLRGITVQVLDEPAWCMHLALHAAQHGPGFPTPLADLRAAMASRDETCWREAAALAQLIGASAAMAAGLALVEGGDAFIRDLSLRPSADREVALRARGATSEMLYLSWWRGLPIREKVLSLARKSVPPPDYMRSWQPLATKGRWGLVVVYVWRPLWLLWRGTKAVVNLVAPSSAGPSQTVRRRRP